MEGILFLLVAIVLYFVSDALVQLGHVVRGCLLCEAAASWLGRNAPGHESQRAEQAFSVLRAMMNAETPTLAAPLDDLAVFEPVSRYRSRHRCVLLAFETALEALQTA